MSAKGSEKVDEVANDLDELNTAVEELRDSPPADVDPGTIDELKQALESATDVADKLEDQEDQADQKDREDQTD